MSNISVAAERLAMTANITDFNQKFKYFSQSEIELLQKELYLPKDMIEWYKTASPDDFEIPSFGNRPILYSPRLLPEVLLEYKFDQSTGQRIQSWKDTWIVFGGEGRYPLIVNSSIIDDKSVYYCEIKKREWNNILLSTEIEGFLLGLSEYINLYILKYNNTITDNQSFLLPDFYKDFSELLNSRPSTYGMVDNWLHGWLGM